MVRYDPTNRDKSALSKAVQVPAGTPCAPNAISQELGLAPGMPTVFAGSRLSGKTPAMILMAVDIMLGRRIWNRFDCQKPGKVAFVYADMIRGHVPDIFCRCLAHYKMGMEDVQDRLTLVTSSRHENKQDVPPLYTQEGIALLKRLASTHDVVLVNNTENFVPRLLPAGPADPRADSWKELCLHADTLSQTFGSIFVFEREVPLTSQRLVMTYAQTEHMARAGAIFMFHNFVPIQKTFQIFRAKTNSAFGDTVEPLGGALFLGDVPSPAWFPDASPGPIAGLFIKSSEYPDMERLGKRKFNEHFTEVTSDGADFNPAEQAAIVKPPKSPQHVN